MGLGSGLRKKPIPDPGSRSKGKKGPDPGSGSATPVFRPRSRSVSTRYGSGFFYHQAKIVRKTLNPTVLFCDFFMTFLSLKNDVNFSSKSNKPKNFERKINCRLEGR